MPGPERDDVMSEKPVRSVPPEIAESAAAALRALPSVHQLVEAVASDARRPDAPRPLIVEAARAALDDARARLTTAPAADSAALLPRLVEAALDRLRRFLRPPLGPVINATGIIIHTGLGRAPLAEHAARAAYESGRGYAPVELDLDSGERGRRSHIVRALLCSLTGAESATVVNNNAAALMITLNTLAAGRSVIVSRGELIEIGGSFRLPDVMKAGGAILREVGTTNRTRLSDYEAAIDDTTAALMKVHTSNYRIAGFTQSVMTDELATLGRHHGLPLIDDIGSGALVDLSTYGVQTDEPSAAAAIAARADLVLFSGDKLLGGPQAGIIVGRADLVERIEKNPMMRALRVDKYTLAALGATLQLHRDPLNATEAVPVLRMLTAPLDDLRQRAQRISEALAGIAAEAALALEEAQAFLGGGSLPTQAIPSIAVKVAPRRIAEQEFAQRLRQLDLPVIPRVRDGAAWFDLRTVFADQDDALIAAIRAALCG